MASSEPRGPIAHASAMAETELLRQRDIVNLQKRRDDAWRRRGWLVVLKTREQLLPEPRWRRLWNCARCRKPAVNLSTVALLASASGLHHRRSASSVEEGQGKPDRTKSVHLPQLVLTLVNIGGESR